MKQLMLGSLSALTMMLSSAALAEPTPMPAKGEAEKGARMFSENDTNKDGTISKDEWRARGDKMFSEIDGNADGKLTPEETKAHREKKRAEWKEKREDHKEHMGEAEEGAPDKSATPAPTPEKQ